MVRQDKARIVQEYSKLNGDVVKLVIKDIVKTHGGSGYVSVPKELVGKYVTVVYDAEATQSAPRRKGK